MDGYYAVEGINILGETNYKFKFKSQDQYIYNGTPWFLCKLYSRNLYQN